MSAYRDVVRCRACGLVQYVAANGRCRKCHTPFRVRVAVPAPVPAIAPVPQPPYSVAIPLKRIRTALQISQRQLAGRLGVPRTYITKIEHPESIYGAIPTLGSLARFADALGVTMADLIEDERGRRAKQVAELLADPFLAQIAEALPGLGRTERSLLLIEVQKLADYNTRAARRGRTI